MSEHSVIESLPTVFSHIVCIGSPSGEKNFRDLVAESEIITLPI